MLRGHVDEDAASEAQLKARLRIVASKGEGFRKKPDKPLGFVLGRKKSKRNE
jgi:hypothetical protein